MPIEDGHVLGQVCHYIHLVPVRVHWSRRPLRLNWSVKERRFLAGRVVHLIIGFGRAIFPLDCDRQGGRFPY